ncbi:hypothetical protein FUAX_55160 (plasmid) [Fulvitalea axinellae]|uniref:DUF4595 domain-containing protein n=1 Tax=Fulvitalea axinellae TaxID=1182444 RepID=A0AAU9DF55_9BACT|nr:hypothetical protein FUAX_55160 [Fulvitalea axinellae]
MMKTRFKIVLMLSFFAFSACDNNDVPLDEKDDTETPDIPDENNGDKGLYKLTKVNIVDKVRAREQVDSYTYNDKGLIERIDMSVVMKEHKWEGMQTFEYDVKDNLTHWIHKTPYGSKERLELNYDDDQIKSLILFTYIGGEKLFMKSTYTPQKIENGQVKEWQVIREEKDSDEKPAGTYEISIVWKHDDKGRLISSDWDDEKHIFKASETFKYGTGNFAIQDIIKHNVVKQWFNHRINVNLASFDMIEEKTSKNSQEETKDRWVYKLSEDKKPYTIQRFMGDGSLWWEKTLEVEEVE